MKIKMKNVLSHMLVLLLCMTALPLYAAEPRDPYTYFFSQSLGDFREELANARKQGKQGVLLFFEMEECPWCHRMKTTVLNQPEVQDYFKAHVLSFPVDIEGDVEIIDFEGNSETQKFFAEKVNRVRATPVFAFYDLEGQQVVRFTGATADPQEFMWLGEFFFDGHYKDMRFSKYKRLKREGKQGQ